MANNKVQLSDGTVLLDLTGDTVTPENLLSGATAHNAAGNRINGAVAPVRYDVAQTLTDAQKRQARGNIGAAPDGFGLGGGSKLLTSDDDVNTIGASGWYTWYSNSVPANAIIVSNITIMRVDAYNPVVKVQTLYGATDGSNFITQPIVARRMIYGSKIGTWEYVNPFVYLGIEYRTTERYLGKPVYCKLVNFGALPNKTSKDVIIASDIYAAVSVDVIGTDGALLTNYDSITSISCSHVAIRIATSVDMSNTSVYCLCKYTKTTN